VKGLKNRSLFFCVCVKTETLQSVSVRGLASSHGVGVADPAGLDGKSSLGSMQRKETQAGPSQPVQPG
jgi:hypothetical protein